MKNPETPTKEKQGILDIITFTDSQSEALEILEQNRNIGINTFELRDAGIAYPAQRVAELKAKGARIDSIRMPATDSFGKRHGKVAHYRFRGWDHG